MSNDSVPSPAHETPTRADPGKFREFYLPIGMVASILVVVVGGGIAWGDAQAQMKSMNTKVTTLEENRRAIEDIKVQQASIKAEVEGVRREQGIHVGTLGSKVDQLDRKLDLLLEKASTRR